jgi:hypothetical protein
MRSKTVKPKPEPEVVIFWMVKNEPLIDSTRSARSKANSDQKIHPGGHYRV